MANLEELLLGGNVISGRIPPDLGSLVNLTALDLRQTMLSGPLPESLTRLSALNWLALDGSALCVPDTPAARAWLARISDFTGGAICAGPLSFLRVVTQLSGLGRLGSVHAVADLDGDGRDDVLAAEYLEYNVAREDRLTKLPLRVLVNVGNGRFRHAPELVEGTIDVRTPIVVADDFNGV